MRPYLPGPMGGLKIKGALQNIHYTKYYYSTTGSKDYLYIKTAGL